MGFQDFSSGNGWQSTNSALKTERFVQPLPLTTGLKKIKIMNCAVHNVALKCLIAAEVWWLVCVCALQPSMDPTCPHTLLQHRDLTRSGNGEPSEQQQLMPPGWSIPAQQLHHSHHSPITHGPCGCSSPVQGGRAGADQELLSALSSIPSCFSAPLRHLQVAPGRVFKVSTCWMTTKNPPIAGGKPAAGNAVAPAWLSAAQRCGSFGKIILSARAA